MADVLNVEESFRVVLTRNGNTFYTQQFSPTAVTFTRLAADTVVLDAGMVAFQEASLGDINSTNLGKHLLVTVDRPITIAVNTTARQVVADTLGMVGTNISHLFFKNTDANNEATVSFVITDQNAT